MTSDISELETEWANSVEEVLLFVEFLIFGVTDSELIVLNKKTVIITYCNILYINTNTALAKQAILQQAGTAILAQANTMKEHTLNLLS